MPRKPKKHRGLFERPVGSGIWWICYFDQYGLKHREKVGFRSTAIEEYRKRKAQVSQKKFNPEDVRQRPERGATCR